MKLVASIVVLLSVSAIAAAPSTTTAARPTADIVVVFDTLQAEKAMDGNLWKRIQTDKKKAQMRSRDKSPFKTEGRDVAGTVNVSFISFSPFRFVADGLVSVSGGKGSSIREDAEALAGMAKDSGYEVVKSGGKKTPIYAFDMKAVPDDDGDEELPVSGAMLTVLDDSQARFTARWGIGAEEARKFEQSGANTVATNAPPPLAAALSATPLSGVALGLVGNAERLAELPLDANEEQRSLKELLVQLSAFAVVFRVDGTDLHIEANLMFKSNDTAVARRDEFVHDCEQLRTEMAAHGSGMLRTIAAGGEDRSVKVNVAIDIRSAWAFLSRFENSGRRPPAASGQSKPPGGSSSVGTRRRGVSKLIQN